MIRIAIVEDTAFDRQVLQDCLREYGQETGTQLQITEFTGGSAFLEQYPDGLDLIFMDIMMDGMDGLTTARKLRRRDNRVLLVFVTSMVTSNLWSTGSSCTPRRGRYLPTCPSPRRRKW